MGRSSNPEIRAAGGGPSPGTGGTSVEGCVTEAGTWCGRAGAAQAECCLSGRKLGPWKSPGRYGGIIPQGALASPSSPLLASTSASHWLNLPRASCYKSQAV